VVVLAGFRRKYCSERVGRYRRCLGVAARRYTWEWVFRGMLGCDMKSEV
jgi:hypothetical protein